MTSSIDPSRRAAIARGARLAGIVIVAAVAGRSASVSAKATKSELLYQEHPHDGKECGADANMAKLLASDATWHAAEATFATFGGFAFAKEYDIERKWREARLYQTAPISTNMILAYLGQHVLGMPRSY